MLCDNITKIADVIIIIIQQSLDVFLYKGVINSGLTFVISMGQSQTLAWTGWHG